VHTFYNNDTNNNKGLKLDDEAVRVAVALRKRISRSYTQRRQTPSRNDSDPMAFKEALSLGCDSRQHHSRVLRRYRSSQTRRGGGNGCHQEMLEVLRVIHGTLVSSNRHGDSGPNE